MPSTSVSIALRIPEILERVGQFIPLWGWEENNHDEPVFLAHNLLPCLSVSRHFRQTMLPIFWYTLDDQAMSDVPVELLSKYATHIRIIDRICGADRRQLFPDNSEPWVAAFLSVFLCCTRLTHFTKTTCPGGDEVVLEIFKRNPRLRHFIWCYESEDGVYDGFENLPQIEYAELYGEYDVDSFPTLLRPIAANVVSLNIPEHDKLFLHSDLVFPNLKTLSLFEGLNESFSALPRICPNLESLKTFIIERDGKKDGLVKLFASGACKKLNTFRMSVGPENLRIFAAILDSHRGFEGLGLMLHAPTATFQPSLRRHGKTLKTLTFNWSSTATPDFIVDILQLCTQLETFAVGWLDDDDDPKPNPIDWLLARDSWKNPDVLESLSIAGSLLSLHCTSINRPEGSLPEGVTSETLSSTPHYGWKVHGGLLVQNMAFLKELFELVNKRFPRLRSIVLNGITYRKVIP